jgi:hypothetical protein
LPVQAVDSRTPGLGKPFNRMRRNQGSLHRGPIRRIYHLLLAASIGAFIDQPSVANHHPRGAVKSESLQHV